ncbi:MAG: hypothetical protein NWE96_00015 [Candidatus Bathyarchaeota archaeon]|nr:hypothetical protein [Candidatus Bathyarchaeota archaeon]
MEPKSKRAFVLCLLGFTVLFFSSMQGVLAQETGMLIVYVESLGGDATFSYTGSPGSLGNFQLATDGGGAAQVFNLTAGTYSITQNALPTNWALSEVFLDGTGTGTVNQQQAKAAFTISSEFDVYYLRFTNYDQTVIPEYPSQAMILVLIVATSTVALYSIRKHKKAAAAPFAFLCSICLLAASVGTAVASPDRYIQIGTRNADEQIQFGASGRDVVVQLGFGGNDIQYAETSGGDDCIVQNGGAGDDAMTAVSGTGDDYMLQDGGDGNDKMYAEAGNGLKTIVARGGGGNDIIELTGGPGGGLLKVSGGDGNDSITIRGGKDNDSIIVDADFGDDTIEYMVTLGTDSVDIDGGAGIDFLTAYKMGHPNFCLLDGAGKVMYALGTGGTSITVINVEHGKVVGDAGETLYQW